jgi:phosphatidylglycerol---prolipoprotein diacylglyceryl transferase
LLCLQTMAMVQRPRKRCAGKLLMLVLPILPFPAINPVLIHLGPLAVRWYALAYIVGIIAGWFYARALIASERVWGGPAPFTVIDFDDFVIWITLGIILGGRTGYVLFYNFPHFAAHPMQILELWNGGMSFHGGVLGCLIAIVLFALRRGIPMLSLGDVTAVVAPIGLFLGRIANFINGELWGRPSDVPWAMIFPNGGPVPRHPSQLYEAALEGVVLFIVLGLLVRAGALKRPGVVTGAFALGYGVARIICEFFREPDVQLGFLWGGLTMGMLLCIPLMLGGIALLAVALKREPKPKNG